MKQKKIVSVLAIAILWLAVPFFAVPRTHAFHDNIQYAMTGIHTYSDPLFGTVQTAREGSTVTLTVLIDASDFTGQQNVTVGVKFSWMTDWLNATNASPASTLAVTRNQFITVTIQVTIPSGPNYNFYSHTWQGRVWTGALNSPSSSIHSTSSTTSFAIYNVAQAEGMAARVEAQEKINSLNALLTTSVEFGEPLPGKSKAIGDISQATAELELGNDFYTSRDFAAANTHYRNALNLANSAANALGGGETASYTNVLFSGIGWLAGGVGVLVAGIGGFLYFLKRPKTPK